MQLDYNLPSEQRFGLEYIGADNQPHRPVMIHRAPLGSMERFIGVLIEHFAGAFPLWLAPEQVRVLTVSEKFNDYGQQVEKQLREAGLRVTGDFRAEKIGSKIRDAQLRLVPYMFVVGGREMEEGTVSVRDRIDGDVGAMPVAGRDRQASGRNSHQKDSPSRQVVRRRRLRSPKRTNISGLRASSGIETRPNNRRLAALRVSLGSFFRLRILLTHPDFRDRYFDVGVRQQRVGSAAARSPLSYHCLYRRTYRSKSLSVSMNKSVSRQFVSLVRTEPS